MHEISWSGLLLHYTYLTCISCVCVCVYVCVCACVQLGLRKLLVSDLLLLIIPSDFTPSVVMLGAEELIKQSYVLSTMVVALLKMCLNCLFSC